MSHRFPRLRWPVVAAAALVLGVATGCSGIPESPPSTEAGRGECPLQSGGEPVAAPTRTGDLVSTEATQAVLCAYQVSDSMRLTAGRPPAARDVAGLIAHLNALETITGKIGACSDMAADEYQILLYYPAGAHALVRINLNCATASSSGAVRRLDSATTLLAFWPTSPPA